MNKDRQVVLGENDVWSSREITAVQSEAKTATMQVAPDLSFRGGVGAADA